jgi:hypothetical protein
VQAGSSSEEQPEQQAAEQAAAAVPVAKLLSLAVRTAAKLAELKEKEAKASEQRKETKVKEIRLTARTDENDLGIKAARVVQFLSSGLSVKVSVAFSKSANSFTREEPARRSAFESLARRVADSGAGFCDSASISGLGIMLSGLFVPIKVAKPLSAWSKVMELLSSPIHGNGSSDGGGGGRWGGSSSSSDTAAAPAAAADAAAAAPKASSEATAGAGPGGRAAGSSSGEASRGSRGSSAEAALPSMDQLLRRFGSPRTEGAPRAPRATAVIAPASPDTGDWDEDSAAPPGSSLLSRARKGGGLLAASLDEDAGAAEPIPVAGAKRASFKSRRK